MILKKISSRETTNHISACFLLKSKKYNYKKREKWVTNIMFAMGEGVLQIPEIPNPNSKIKQFPFL